MSIKSFHGTSPILSGRPCTEDRLAAAVRVENYSKGRKGAQQLSFCAFVFNLNFSCVWQEWVKQKAVVQHTIAERDILVTLKQSRHPFLVSLIHSFQTALELYLVLDYCPGGDLASQVRKTTTTTRTLLSYVFFLSAQCQEETVAAGYSVLRC